MNHNLKVLLRIVLLSAALAIICYAAFFRTFAVLDRGASGGREDAAPAIRLYSESRLTSASSTNRVERTEEGRLRTRPDEGFCAS